MRVAKRCAGVADLGTLGAQMAVMRRAPRHEVGAHRTDLRAIQQRDQVLRFRVRALAVKHVRSRFGADTVTLQARGDALVHLLLIHCKCSMMTCCAFLGANEPEGACERQHRVPKLRT